MDKILLVCAALAGYCIGGWNPAITFAKLIYHKDIRTLGSGNPGFTNFKRTFGNKWAWWVFALDLGKAAAGLAVFCVLYSLYGGSFSFMAAYMGIFLLAGHAFPVWYKFKGGKGFLVYMSVIYFVDWRIGLIVTALLAALLFSTNIMSVATLSTVGATIILLLIPVFGHFFDAPVFFLCLAQVVFIFIRHRENIKRLFTGKEAKFFSKGKKK